MSKLTLILIFTVSTLFTVASQTCLKYGLNELGAISFNFSALPSTIIKMMLNMYIWGFFIFALIAMFLWIWGLAYVELSFAYPFLTVGYIIVMISSAVFLGEGVSLMRWIGVILVSTGMYFVYIS